MANNKDLKYNGYSAVPSDYECQDGALAVSINLIPEDGALHPISEPNKVKNLSSDSGNIRFIHKGASYTHYILQDGNIVKWMDADQSSGEIITIINITSLYEIYEFNAIGNTLLVLTSGGIYYILWKDGKYVVLGTHIPECPISFGLQGEMRASDQFWVSTGDEHIWWDDNAESIWLNDYEKGLFTPAVLAQANKFIADSSINDGRFIFPFFVRYAYRLYDGTLTMHSAPVLMVCTSDMTPYCMVTKFGRRGNEVEGVTMRMCAIAHQLDYAADPATLNTLKAWSDIVKSVDIFVSKPIYGYDQNGEVKRFISVAIGDVYTICKHTNQAASLSTPVRYQTQTISYVYTKTFTPNEIGEIEKKWRVALPKRDEEAIKSDIADNCLFYLLKSINLDEVKTERTIIPINKEYLPSLTSREVMTDDYNSHDLIIPKTSSVYNSRLNITNLKQQLFQGHHPYSCFPYTNGHVRHWKDAYEEAIDHCAQVWIYYYIKQDGREIIVNGGWADVGLRTPLLWLYYPNVNAYKAVLRMLDYSSPYYYEVPLEPHPFLNGAFYFGDWKGINVEDNYTALRPKISSGEDRTLEIPNKIYTSEVNNPFVFPVLGINTVGTGEIKGICSAAKALSEGQFGQFPLYAFTTEGVWALEVSSTGTYSARQPITRDVCINSDGITQLDSAVLFPTDRGIMLISGSQTICISDAINSEFPFDALTLPGFSKLHDMLGHNPGTDKCLPTLPFTEFLKQCKMIYDYVHQRVIVYAPGITYAYVFSLKSKEWGMIFSNIASHLNSYPEALAVDTDNNIVNFSEPVIKPVNCLYVSRPLKLDAPDVHKTIENIIQRGNFRKGHVSTVLYGSRDLVNWHLVWSSKDHYLRGFRGTPYKYFRIAGVANLDPKENIVGASIQFTPKLTNQPR